MLESPKLHKHIQIIAEKFLGLFSAADVENLDMNRAAKEAMLLIKKALSALLVLLVPTPGYMGTSPSDAAQVVSYEPVAKSARKDATTSDAEDFTAALQMFLQDSEFWQGKIDEVLAMGTSSMKLGDRLKDLTTKLAGTDEDGSLNEHFVDAVHSFKDIAGGLRRGATASLEEILVKKTQQCVEKLCGQEDVSETDAANIQVIMKALDLFAPSKHLGDLKQKFLKWQASMAATLNMKEIAALTDKINSELGNEDADIPLDAVKKLLDGFGGSGNKSSQPGTG